MKTNLFAGIAAAAVVAAVGTGSALAADALPPIVEAPYYEAPATFEPISSETVSSASGWYLRGDVGYAWNKSRGVDFFQGGNDLYSPFTTSKLRGGYSIGGGVGYKTSSRMRFDATLDYFGKTKFRGSTTGGGSGSGACATSCTSEDLSEYTALSLLANAYVDLYTHGRFSFYAGAGLGGTYVKWDGLDNTSCPTGTGVCDPTISHGGAANWRFTYALMAGTTININCALDADVGYRYRNVRGGKMFEYASAGGPGYDRGFHSHEVRGGLRYTFGGCDEPPVEPPVFTPPPVYK
ncbi:outer membrane protein [Pseudohoeflea suaedae]|nr:outer membrane protein [Pseudohoeflea suaedae]